MFNDWGKQEINTPTAQICVMSDEFEIWEVGGDNNNRIFKFTETIPGVYSSKQARNELLSYIKTQGYHFLIISQKMNHQYSSEHHQYQ